MLPIKIVSVSKPPKGPYQELNQQYASFLKQFAVVEFTHVKPSSFASVADRARVQSEEAERIMTSVPNDALLVALHEHGDEMTSEDFSTFIGIQKDAGQKLCFVIGGPLGLDPGFLERADRTLSLSQMTLPHDLAHVVLLEQLYRAFTILTGKSYHY